MRNFICMCLCLAGLVFLTTSDALINMSASDMMGSNESADSYKSVAIGVTIGLLALGSIASILPGGAGQWGLWFVTFLAAIFSGVLTVQAVSIDYAANDHSGAIQHANRAANKDKQKQLTQQYSASSELWAECGRDRYYGSSDCKKAKATMDEITAKRMQISDATAATVRAQKVDITDAVEEKAGISAVVLERIMIYSRAAAVPLMMAILMHGFWAFWGRAFSGASSVVKKWRATA